MRRQVVWENNSQQIIEKQKSVKTCTESPKIETPPPYMEVVVASTKKEMVV